ncbi:MAG: DNA helicase RecQ [Candidatus Aenigmarchaeota archaeon]|nr:DNA helicase RecQ [Candidatus Aenigmarchaeota archaeon]
MQNALEMLKKHFGYSEFNPMQKDIVSDILSGRDVFVLMPTGSGKSLCYQLPAVMKSGITVVISPLIALMKDQVDSLRSNGIGASFINSTLRESEIEEVKIRLLENRDKILYVAPERLSSLDFISFLKTLPIVLFAIDEAHCISEWGHDFRPEYRRLGTIRENFPGTPIVALTATAIPDVQKDIVQHLHLKDPQIYKASFNRGNLFYRVLPKDDAYVQLADYIKKRPNDSGIIYCQSRKTAESLAKKLCSDGFSALPYHAGLSAAERTENQEKFIRDDVGIIVATIAFGMGINKSNVRYVIHYDLPKNVEGYYQETGRAGRDGLDSDCILLFSHGDRMKIVVLIEKGYNQRKKRVAYEKLDGMISFCESTECRRKSLLSYFGEEYGGQCEKCDNCLNPKEKTDGSETAKKVIRCILELNQRFGANYVISMLLGKGNKRSKAYNHHSLASYGTGKEYTAVQWQSFIRELIKEGYIIVSGTKYPVLKINSKSLGLLSGRLSVQLTKPAEKKDAEHETKKETGKEPAELFDILRLLRKEIADSEKVPPYVIFHDSTLKEMAVHQPQTVESLKKIKGVGQIKLEKYGKTFLEKIAEFCRLHAEYNPTPKMDIYGRTLELCRQGLALDQIAKARGVAPSTIVSHLEKLIATGENVNIDAVVRAEKQRAIENCMGKMDTMSLTALKESLGDDYSYDEIRLVRAKFNARNKFS